MLSSAWRSSAVNTKNAMRAEFSMISIRVPVWRPAVGSMLNSSQGRASVWDMKIWSLSYFRRATVTNEDLASWRGNSEDAEQPFQRWQPVKN